MSLVPQPETTAAVHLLFRFPSYGAAAILSQDSVECRSTLLGTQPTFLTKTSNSTSIVISATLTSFYFAELGGHENAVISQATPFSSRPSPRASNSPLPRSIPCSAPSQTIFHPDKGSDTAVNAASLSSHPCHHEKPKHQHHAGLRVVVLHAAIGEVYMLRVCMQSFELHAVVVLG